MPQAERQWKLIEPMDSAGLDYSRPTTQRLWTRLDNVIFRNGTMQTRPGFVPVGPGYQDVATAPAGIPTLLLEANGALFAKETTGTFTSTIVRPDDTIDAGSWTLTGAATVHECLDEDPPDDDTTKVSSSADDDFTVQFPASGDSFEIVSGVTIWTRARCDEGNDQATLTLKDENGYTLGTIELANAEARPADGTIQGYRDYFTFVPYYIDSSGNAVPWDVDNLTDYYVEWSLELNSTANSNAEILGPAGFGDENDFDQADVTWADGLPMAFSMNGDTYTTGNQGDKVSFEFDPPKFTYESITSVEFRVALQHASEYSTSKVQFFHEGTATTDIGAEQLIKGSNWSDSNLPTWHPDRGPDILTTGALTTNPETGLAWTQAQLDAGVKFGIELVSSGSGNVGDIQLAEVEIVVKGPVEESGVAITAVGLFIHGMDRTGSNQPSEDLGRLMVTTARFQQLESNTTFDDADRDLVDVHGSATEPGAGPFSWDWTEFFNKAFIENGRDDTWSYPNGAGNEVNDLTTNNIGRTIWTFGQRLMKGDILAGGTRSTKRIAWSGLADETDWSSSTSGDLDLTHGGSGRIRKGMPLSSHVVAVYLDRGIYNLEWTGDDTIPFVPTMQIEDVGCLAGGTVRSIVDKGGSTLQFFLGEGNNGVSVFAYDGASAYDIAPEIRDQITSDANFDYIQNSFAGVDRKNNLYLLAIPASGQLFPEQLWVYHIDLGHWVKWTLPMPITCMGYWSLLRNQDLYDYSFAFNAERTLVFGTYIGVPFKLDSDRHVDVTMPGEGDPDKEYSSRQITNATHGPSRSRGFWDQEVPIEVVIESGDFALSQDGSLRLTSVDGVWFTFIDRGRLSYTVSESIDGGQNYINSTSWDFNGTDSEELSYRMLFFATPTNGRRHRIKLTYSSTSEREHLEIVDMAIAYKEAGRLP